MWQSDGEQFTRLVRLNCEELHLRLLLEWWYTISDRRYEAQTTVAQMCVARLDTTHPNSTLRPRLDILGRTAHFLKWPDQACEFEMLGCSQKIVAPWVQWQTPPTTTNRAKYIRE